METRWKADLLPYLTEPVRCALDGVAASAPVEELRIRVNQPIQLLFPDGERLIFGPKGRPLTTQADMDAIVSRICGQSVYVYAEELSAGFVTICGGYRVGITGRCVMENGKALRLTDVTAVNIRIPRAVKGAVGEAIAHISADGVLLSTLILSEPGGGKTTFLRELIRLCSSGKLGLRAHKVSVVDTRAELSGADRGSSVFDLGPRTDVRTGGDKASGFTAMLMTMSPDVLATDEIGTLADARAVFDARFAGVAVLATAHASSLGDICRRTAFRQLIAARAFDRYILLTKREHPGKIEGIFDYDGKLLYKTEGIWQKCLQC